MVPDLDFQVTGAESQPFAVAPLLAFKIRVANANPEEPIHTIALRCQIQIEATRRRYDDAEQRRLLDLFGEPERWGQTLKTMLWTHTSAVVSRFSGAGEFDLLVPCTFDFNVAATKYFAGIDDGEVPLCLQFSGTVFFEGAGGALQVAQIPWSTETKYRLPLIVWQAMMEQYYPNSAWLCFRRDVFDRLSEYKMARGIPTWEQVFDELLASVDAEVRR